jgi:hypothetical protein
MSGASPPDLSWDLLAGGYVDGTAVWYGVCQSGAAAGPLQCAEVPTWQTDNKILPDLRTKEFLLDGGTTEKLVGDVEIGYWIDTPARLTVTRLTGYQQNTTTILPSAGLALDTYGDDSALGAARLIRKWTSRLLPANPGERSIGHSAQVHLTTTPGIYIDSAMARFEYVPDFSSPQYRTIQTGWYGSVYDVLAAITDAVDDLTSTWAIASAQTGLAGLKLTGVGGSEFIRIPLAESELFDPTVGNARLFALFGWRESRIVLDVTSLTNYTYADDLVLPTRSPLLQINALKLRVRTYARKPT